MTNKEIIYTEAISNGVEYTGENLYTFAEWKKRGYTVEKGEHALLKCKLWIKGTKIDKKTNEKVLTMFLKTACLFSDKQVKKID